MIKKYKNMLMLKTLNQYIISKTLLNLFSEFNVFNLEKYLFSNKDNVIIGDVNTLLQFYNLNECNIENAFNNKDYSFFNIYLRMYLNHSNEYSVISKNHEYFIDGEFVILNFNNDNALIKFDKMIKEKFNKLDKSLTSFDKEIRLFKKNKPNHLIKHKDLSPEFIDYFSDEIKCLTKSKDIVFVRDVLYKIINTQSDKKLREINYSYLLFKEKHKKDYKKIKKYYNKFDNVCDKYLLLDLLKDCINILNTYEGQHIFNEKYLTPFCDFGTSDDCPF